MLREDDSSQRAFPRSSQEAVGSDRERESGGETETDREGVTDMQSAGDVRRKYYRDVTETRCAGERQQHKTDRK